MSGPPKPKPSVIDLDRLMDKRVRVKCIGGREFTGILKGHDPVPNLVLDECVEYLRDENDLYVLNGESREIGLLLIRGTSLIAVGPEDGIESISNPFVSAVDE